MCSLRGGVKTTIALGDYGFVWSLCNACGFVYLSSQLSHHSLNEFYGSGEYQSVCMGGLNDQKHFELEKNVMSKCFVDVFDSLDISLSNASIMEIGCGSGGILAALAERGCSVEGFDLDPERIEFGKKMGVENLFVADALDPNTKFQKNYDWVIISNVLEHLFDPNQFLMLLQQKFSKSSINVKIIIDVPNLEGLSFYGQKTTDFFHVAHLWYFSPITLEKMLKDAGFCVLYRFVRGAAMTFVCCLAVGSSESMLTKTDEAYRQAIFSFNQSNRRNIEYT